MLNLLLEAQPVDTDLLGVQLYSELHVAHLTANSILDRTGNRAVSLGLEHRPDPFREAVFVDVLHTACALAWSNEEFLRLLGCLQADPALKGLVDRAYLLDRLAAFLHFDVDDF